MTEPNHFQIPPWKSSGQWAEVGRSLELVSSQRRRSLGQARQLARLIEKKLRAVDGGIEGLCHDTCVRCQDICCEKATVWYDFRDLLYLQLSSGQLPAEQLCKKNDLSCTQLTTMGCQLPRTRRPFICTWYLCPAQAALCREEGERGDVVAALQEIQRLRKELEREFVQAVC